MSVQTPQAPPEPATRACPRCGASLTPDQEWCLNCGADVGARIAGTPRWRVPVVLVGLLIAAALAAIALALIELADDDQQVAQAPTTQTAAAPTATPPPAPTGEQPAPGEAGGSPQAQVPEASDDQTATGQSNPTPTPDSQGNTNGQSGTGSTTQPGTGTTAAWPAGKTAWTVILESATSKSAADQKAQELQSGGTTVGVLHSDDFSSLNSGYWVVFSGQYDSKSAADSALSGLKATVPEAYVRHVVPKSA